MRPLDRTRLVKKYQGQWLALQPDRKTVVASGNTASNALRAAQKKGCGAPILTRMPRDVRSFIGAA